MFCTKHDHTVSLIADNHSLTLFSPYLTASLSISYFTIGTHIKVSNTILSVRCSLLKNINCLSSIRKNKGTD